MTGAEDFLRGLDDPAGVPAQPPAIDGVLSRGRQIRARRFAIVTGSAAVLSTAVAVAAFGVVPGIDAARTDNQQVTPATQPPSATSATKAPHKHGAGSQVVKVAPGGRGGAPTRSPSTPPVTVPVVDPCASPSPAAVDPSATSEPSPATTDAESTSTCTSPSPSTSPSGDATPTPADSPTVSASPAVMVTPDVPLGN